MSSPVGVFISRAMATIVSVLLLLDGSGC